MRSSIIPQHGKQEARDDMALGRSTKGRATLTEIAAVAKVSVATVSNVANGRWHLMSPATRERVETVMRALNYRPNEGARSLRLAQRRSIGLIIVDDSPTFLADPMNTNILAGFSNFLSVNGFGLLLSGVRHNAIDDAHLIRRDQTDALCVIPSGTAVERRRLYRRLKDTGQPILVFQDEAPDFLTDALSVRQDDRTAGTLVAGRVVDRGARRLVLLVPSQQWPAMSARQAGIEDVVARTDGAVRFDIVVCGSESMADTQTAIARYVDREGLPDVFMGGNDQMAIAAITWAVDRHLTVPKDIRVTGFNGFDFADYVRPRLTTVTSPAYEMGRTGAALLLRRLSEGSFAERHRMLDVTLRVGDSD
jgi:DNA-binding LacI/PurR family transcriptional regulator